MDPFTGVGTTLVEADLAGHEAAGFEINPYAAFVSATKLKAHRIDTVELREAAASFKNHMRAGKKPRAEAPKSFRTRSPFYSPKVERKVLSLLDFVDGCDGLVRDSFKLAFAASMVSFSNYSYEPSLGRRSAAGKPEIDDFPVADAVYNKVCRMADDADWYGNARAPRRRRDGRVFEASFLDGYGRLGKSADLLVTSPPYLNNYHYNRNTRPHMYWLGMCSSSGDLRRLEEMNFGTYWQTVRERDRIELEPAASDRAIECVLSEIRSKNADRGIYGGRGWANYAAQYFNDCSRFAKAAMQCVRPGGAALIVIGNSIIQGVHVPTDRFLAKIASAHGFEVRGIDVPRSTRVGNSITDSAVRVGGSGGRKLYEAVVELRRP